MQSRIPSEIEQELTKLSAEFADLQAAREQVFQQHWNRKLDPASIKDAGMASAGTSVEVNEALHMRLDDICRFYVKAENGARQKMRDVVSASKPLKYALDRHLGWCANSIKSDADGDFLIAALAAISLGDNGTDYRDNYLALGHIYVTCMEKGIQPSMAFQKVGMLSSTAPKPQGSTREFLMQFEQSAFFASSVAPKLS